MVRRAGSIMLLPSVASQQVCPKRSAAQEDIVRPVHRIEGGDPRGIDDIGDRAFTFI
jgi:hypothetical protein